MPSRNRIDEWARPRRWALPRFRTALDFSATCFCLGTAAFAIGTLAHMPSSDAAYLIGALAGAALMGAGSYGHAFFKSLRGVAS